MTLNSDNIIVGAARIFLGPSGTAKPAPVAGTRYSTTLAGADGSTSTGVGTLVTNWQEIGYTTDGFEVSHDPTYTDIEVDQRLAPVKTFKTAQMVSVSTTMVENTLDNMLMAWGQLGSTVSSVGPFERELVVNAGDLGDAPNERGLIAIGNAGASQVAGVAGERVYHLFRVLSVEATTTSLSRTDAAALPVTFRAYPDDATGRFGTVRDRTGTFTS